MSGPALPALYDGWWASARTAFAAGEAQVDPPLAGAVPDRRRGMTLVAKPDAAGAARLFAALAPLREAEPDQYVYAPGELHATFLSPFGATPEYRRPDGLDAYVAALREIVATVPRFAIALRGLTATREAVLVQGFPDDDGLNRARDAFRERFAASGLPGRTDTRFRATSAHLTVMRFRRPLRDGAALAARIEAMRGLPLGRIEATTLTLTENDWYHSAARTETLATLPLK